MIHYYMHKGHDPAKLAAMSPLEKVFMYASMELYSEEMREAFGK